MCGEIVIRGETELAGDGRCAQAAARIMKENLMASNKNCIFTRGLEDFLLYFSFYCCKGSSQEAFRERSGYNEADQHGALIKTVYQRIAGLLSGPLQ